MMRLNQCCSSILSLSFLQELPSYLLRLFAKCSFKFNVRLGDSKGPLSLFVAFVIYILLQIPSTPSSPFDWPYTLMRFAFLNSVNLILISSKVFSLAFEKFSLIIRISCTKLIRGSVLGAAIASLDAISFIERKDHGWAKKNGSISSSRNNLPFDCYFGLNIIFFINSIC